MKHQIPVSKSEPAPSPANALVLGLGSSGEAAARLLLGRGVAVTVIDRSDGAVVDARAAALRSQGACVVTGAMELPTNVYDLCVASPGLPVDSGWVAALVKRGVPVISELELAYRHAPCPILAITGTNGKSTLTRLCGDAMAAAGLRVEVGGNYGTPACETVCGDDVLEWLVWEVSSFQLETCHAFAPRVGVILNIQPDHLDRHGSLAHYAELKVSMLANMADGMAVIVPHSERDRVLGQTINLGTGTDTSVVEIARRILRLLNKPESLLQFIDDRPGQVTRHISSTKKSRECLEWESKIDLDEGLARTIEFYQNNRQWWERVMWMKELWAPKG